MMTSFNIPSFTFRRQWQQSMRQSKRELVSDDEVDPAMEKHMTLPTRVSLIPKVNALTSQIETNFLDDEDDEDDDDYGDFDDNESSSHENDFPSFKRHATLASRNSMTGIASRLGRPDPEEAKETESFDGNQEDSIATQTQREVYNHRRDASSVFSVRTSNAYDLTSLKASDSIVEQQMDILRQIQEENNQAPAYKAKTTTSIESAPSRQESGSLKRQRSTAHPTRFLETSSVRRTSCKGLPLYGTAYSISDDAATESVSCPTPHFEKCATANLALFLQGRQVESITKARVEEATKMGKVIKVGCVGCGAELLAANDMTMVYCPSCRTLAPLDLAIIAVKSL
ncbi:hypothetical protein MPSEU_000480800 [Mayamaea pseudoterrestris]|nr:hypothetical protein MPSEU_000480800 [Mayamaea pseudoterrestris]